MGAKEGRPEGGRLPDGYSAGITPDGVIYFVDHQSQTTSHIDPRTKLLYPITGRLPEGWLVKTDPKTHVFFFLFSATGVDFKKDDLLAQANTPDKAHHEKTLRVSDK